MRLPTGALSAILTQTISGYPFMAARTAKKKKIKAKTAKTKPPAKKIFVVEDDQVISEYLESTLEDFGYQVGSCSLGAQAWAKISMQNPDLILMDVMLPDMDGITLCKQLHSDSQTGKIPIIMLTCLTDSSTIRQAYSYGAVDFIGKPFDRATLKSRVQKALFKE